MAGVEDFVRAPSEEFVEQCTKEQLLKLAEVYGIYVSDKRLKDNVKAIVLANLYDQGVLACASGPPAEGKAAGRVSAQVADSNVTFEQQKELLTLRFRLETEKELELEQLRQKADLEKAVTLEKVKQQVELTKLDLETQRLNLMSDGKFVGGRSGDSGEILSSLRLVPKFNERDVDTFFVLFERVANTRAWSDADRVVLLQCVLTGRAQEAFSSLPVSDSGDYSKVKAAVLQSYELVPEAYRQRFRSWRKGDKSHLEFARVLGTHFHRWCAAAGVTDFGGLCDLIVLEQFKNAVSERLAVYISEKKVSTAAEAAALADDYLLTHKRGRGDFPVCADGPVGGVSSWDRPRAGFSPARRNDRGQNSWLPGRGRENENFCHFCHEKGHWKNECPVRKTRTKFGGGFVKPAAMAAPVSGAVRQCGDVPSSVQLNPDLKSFLPFVSKGYVSLVGSQDKVPVIMLRDTAAFDSFIVGSALPFSEESDTGSFVPIRGMGMSVFRVPLHKLVLQSDLFSGVVNMGVRPALPVEGIHVILGNDVAGGRVWPDQPARPLVVPVPLGTRGAR